MSVIHKMGAGDRLPVIETTATEIDGTVVDLTGCTAVLAYKAKSGSGSTTTETVTITDAAAGTMEYAWADGDTDNLAGDYNAQWIVTNAAGKERTFPADGYDTIRITPRL